MGIDDLKLYFVCGFDSSDILNLDIDDSKQVMNYTPPHYAALLHCTTLHPTALGAGAAVPSAPPALGLSPAGARQGPDVAGSAAWVAPTQRTLT